jgi:hypothetical protein
VADRFDLKFRIIVVAPPPDVVFALQASSGGRGLIHPTRATDEVIVFNVRVRADASSGRTVKLSSSIVQGPAPGRFVALASGTRAGQTDSTWGRTAKVALSGLTRRMIDQAHESGSVLEIEIAGSAPDGGPADGAVAPRGGWRLGRP